MSQVISAQKGYHTWHLMQAINILYPSKALIQYKKWFQHIQDSYSTCYP